MKDSVVRGCLLRLLYEHRSEGAIPFGRLEEALPPPPGISQRDWLRAVAQLSEYGLIDWSPLKDTSGMGRLSGFAKINDLGVKVLETGVASPIEVSIDEKQQITIPKGEQASSLTTSAQQQMLTDALENVIIAIDKANVSEEEKNQSKWLLRKLLASKAVIDLLGDSAQSLAAKYFKR